MIIIIVLARLDIPLNLWNYDFVHYATMGTIKLQSSMELQLSMAPGAGSSCSALIGSELERPLVLRELHYNG